MKLGYLGPAGSFSELAAEDCQAEVAEYIPYQDLRSLIIGVDQGRLDRAIVPIENSLEGAVNLTLDLLVEFELKIADEVVIPIEHSLIAARKLDLDEITNIISHPHALAQCRMFLTENLDQYRTYPAESTAGAAKSLVDKGADWAAIGTTKAAKNYNLEVIARSIQDNQNNWTRFIILGQEAASPSGEDKTSIVCSTIEDHPGALYEILQEFAEREINLTRIESRPAKKMLGDYIFFIDFVGHQQEAIIQAALAAIEEKTSWSKRLGSYPRSPVFDAE